MVGTPTHMSPAQLTGLPADGRGDRGSTGVVLYERLTGRSPVLAETPAQVMHKVLLVHPDPSSSLQPSLPPACDTVIARALGNDPALLLLDEPAAGLRHKEKQALIGVLRQLKAEGLSILLVEHDMDLVMDVSDRIVVMEFGTRLIEGTPEEIQASPAVRAAYLGTEH